MAELLSIQTITLSDILFIIKMSVRSSANKTEDTDSLKQTIVINVLNCH